MGFQVFERLPLGPIIRIVLQIAEPETLVLPVDVFCRIHSRHYTGTPTTCNGKSFLFIPSMFRTQQTASMDRRLRPGPRVGVGGVKKRLPTPLIHFDTSSTRLIESLKSAKAPGRTASAPLRGKSQLGELDAKSNNEPMFATVRHRASELRGVAAFTEYGQFKSIDDRRVN